MANQAANNDLLYQQALSAALGELHTLTDQIDHLQCELDRLERQKAAVEAICQSIGQWIDAKESEETSEEFFSSYETGSAVSLTEEEISLIAYPAHMTRKA